MKSLILRKEAYNLACETYDSLQGESFKGNWVWRTSTIPKIRCFLWQCLHKSIPAREVLIVRGLNTPFSCPICCNEVESIIHILRDCPQARIFWDSFPPPVPPNIFYGTNLLDWLQINCNFHQRSIHNIPKGSLFLFGV